MRGRDDAPRCFRLDGDQSARGAEQLSLRMGVPRRAARLVLNPQTDGEDGRGDHHVWRPRRIDWPSDVSAARSGSQAGSSATARNPRKEIRDDCACDPRAAGRPIPRPVRSEHAGRAADAPSHRRLSPGRRWQDARSLRFRRACARPEINPGGSRCQLRDRDRRRAPRGEPACRQRTQAGRDDRACQSIRLLRVCRRALGGWTKSPGCSRAKKTTATSVRARRIKRRSVDRRRVCPAPRFG